MPAQRKKTKPKTKAQKKPASKKSTLKRRTRRGKKKNSLKKNIFVILGVLLLISMVAFGYFLGNNGSSSQHKTLHSKTSTKDKNNEYGTKELLNDLSKIDVSEPKVIKKEKPFVISEFGCGAISGFKSFEFARWSENYQYIFLQTYINAIIKRDFIGGAFISTFQDYRCSPRSGFFEHPKEYNNNGIVDMNRNPKIVYYMVQELYKVWKEGENPQDRLLDGSTVI